MRGVWSAVPRRSLPRSSSTRISRLSTHGRTESPALAWRLKIDFAPAVKLTLPKFSFASNRSDKEHSQPFNFPLLLQQLRSLTWMLAQEAKTPPAFIEEEFLEAMLEPLRWRAEGHA